MHICLKDLGVLLEVFCLATASFTAMGLMFQRGDGACELLKHVSALLSKGVFLESVMEKEWALSELYEQVAHCYV